MTWERKKYFWMTSVWAQSVFVNQAYITVSCHEYLDFWRSLNTLNYASVIFMRFFEVFVRVRRRSRLCPVGLWSQRKRSQARIIQWHSIGSTHVAGWMTEHWKKKSKPTLRERRRLTLKHVKQTFLKLLKNKLWDVMKSVLLANRPHLIP